jgi:pyruvate dehydrogenase E2 component (dihydrolipoamide acetyltransferase)
MTAVLLDPERWEAVEAGDAAWLDRWRVAEGDHVRAGQVLADATLVQQRVEVPAPHDGIVEQIVVAAGERFGLGDVLAHLITH